MGHPRCCGYQCVGAGAWGSSVWAGSSPLRVGASAKGDRCVVKGSPALLGLPDPAPPGARRRRSVLTCLTCLPNLARRPELRPWRRAGSFPSDRAGTSASPRLPGRGSGVSLGL
ncbi:hypothetical protein P7K49_026602 [Saguinus oedipus]|uniref:Uncharacterized protein n=1 Tax=Saguinus oedipus TaxID=9490 RepID=A0ABQ9UDR4_SAGOE|nr:hypothetical protein P7K49_026602 [Saguinus oedipus]